MCGGWACNSYYLACNNPPLSTLRFTGRDFIPTPCGPHDKCNVDGCCADPPKVNIMVMVGVKKSAHNQETVKEDCQDKGSPSDPK